MKTIPVALQSHLDEEATTTCLLVRTLTKEGDLLAFTNLDADVTYDPSVVDPGGTGDDWGSAVHRADNGFTPERLQASADLAVDNSEIQGWVSDTGITLQQLRAGLLDFAEVRVYRVNYMDLTQGHDLVFAGTVGETKFSTNGWRAEWRSLTGQLKQPICQLYSTTCRKKFGSKPIGTGGEQPEEKHPCGKDWVWVAGEVTAVDTDEPDRIFTDSSMTEADGHYTPGVSRWLTGNNAGAQMEIDGNVSDVISLTLPLAYPIEVGDTYERRQDCNKIARTINGVQGDCKDKHDNLINFGGEHLIPVADGGASLIPGAQIHQ